MNDTMPAVIIHGTPTDHVLQPGGVLEVGTLAAPGADEFTGTIDGEPFSLILEIRRRGEYRVGAVEPAQFRIPLSEFVRVAS